VLPGSPVQLGVLAIPTYTPPVLLYPDDVPAVWAPIPATAGTVPAQPSSFEVCRIDDHLVLHVQIFPVAYEALTGQTTLYRQLVVRVVYDTPAPVAVVHFASTPSPVPPGGEIPTVVRLVNVSDQPVVLDATLSLHDLYGHQVAHTTSGGYTVEAGATVDMTPSCPAPAAEGSYSVRLELDHDGEVVADSTGSVAVMTGHIAAFDAPRVVVPGSPVAISVTYANITGASVVADVAVQVLDLAGRSEDDLGTVSLTIPAGREGTAVISWDGRTVPLGRYQLRATATPEGGHTRTAVRLVAVQPLPPREPPRHPAGRQGP